MLLPVTVAMQVSGHRSQAPSRHAASLQADRGGVMCGRSLQADRGGVQSLAGEVEDKCLVQKPLLGQGPCVAEAVAWKTCRPELGLFAGDVDHLGLAGPHYATNCRTWGRCHLLLRATSSILNSISARTSRWRVDSSC